MKLFINRGKENWVVDRFYNEWNKYNYKTSKLYNFGEKIIWLMAPWTWEKIPIRYLEKNKTLCTIHHIDEDKFDDQEYKKFIQRDEFVDRYHAISQSTFKQLEKLTKKPISTIPFWVNQNIWFYQKNKESIRKKYNIPDNSYCIGSFQRDTEGKDLISPKLSKGPDRLLEIIKHYNNIEKNLLVVLSGKRRNFIIDKLKHFEIPFIYFEMTDFRTLNDLYNILNLYIVSSRFEGGPQAILECALTKTPIISTDVGISKEILNPVSIFNMSNFQMAKADTETPFSNVQKFKIPNGFNKFNDMIRELSED